MSEAKPTPKPKKRKRGQPRKSEPWRLNRFIEGTRLGLTRKLAAQYANLSLSTAEDYLKKGRDGDPDYVKFSEAVYAAESDGAAVLLKQIMKHSRKDWRAAAWVLNNRHGDEYKSKQVVAGDPDAPIAVTEIALPARRKEDE